MTSDPCWWERWPTADTTDEEIEDRMRHANLGGMLRDLLALLRNNARARRDARLVALRSSDAIAVFDAQLAELVERRGGVWPEQVQVHPTALVALVRAIETRASGGIPQAGVGPFGEPEMIVMGTAAGMIEVIADESVPPDEIRAPRSLRLVRS